MTFSIVGRSDDGDSWGVAVASKFLAVGSAVPAGRAGVGALATQAHANVGWKRTGMSLLAAGRSAADTLQQLIDGDDGRAQRQLGLVDASGASATHTGAECLDWAGGVAGPGFAIQGNILVSAGVVEAMQQAWSAKVNQSLAQRLLTALVAGDGAGGDRRGRQSAALLVVREGGGYNGLDDIAVDLRVDDHPAPIPELGRLLALNEFYLSAPADADRVRTTPELLAELDDRAQGLGHSDFLAWVGTENYEMRVAEDASWVDGRVIEILRGA